MYLWREGRFHALGLSFTPPEGFFLIVSPEGPYDHALTFCAPDRSFRVTVQAIRGCADSRRELESLFAEDGVQPEGDITPVSLGGFAGNQVCYSGGWGRYYELRLDLPCAEEEGASFVLLLCAEDTELKTALSHPGVCALLQSIQASEFRFDIDEEEEY